MTQTNISTKQEQTHRHREQTCGCQGGRIRGIRGGMCWEFGVSRCKLLHVEWITTRSYCIARGTIFNILR